MPQINIANKNVFISWTSADEAIKNKIFDFLTERGISCLISSGEGNKGECAGNFAEWSESAPEHATVFLLIYTHNSKDKEWVGVEIESFKKLYGEDYRNHLVPVVFTEQFPDTTFPDFDKTSAVLVEGGNIEDKLGEIFKKTENLLINQAFELYNKNTRQEGISLLSMIRRINIANNPNAEVYINRSVIDEEEREFPSPDFFSGMGNVFYLHGPAGIGKSSYVNQIRANLGEETLLIKLNCQSVARAESEPDNNGILFSELFKAFKRRISVGVEYSAENFKSLLRAKSLLVVLDGIDEVATETGKKLAASNAAEYFRGNRERTTLLFTGRNEGDRGKIESARILTLKPFDDENAKRLSENLLNLLGKSDFDKFYNETLGLDAEIRLNPLLLTQLAIVYSVKGKVPKTAIGIYDAVSEILFAYREGELFNEHEKGVREVVSGGLRELLTRYSFNKYTHPEYSAKSLIGNALRALYNDERYREESFVESVCDYLESRLIIDEKGEFYHKSFLEYFVAIYYTKRCFGARTEFDFEGELNDTSALDGLLENYNNGYWFAVIKLFLLKADAELLESVIIRVVARALEREDITDFTLLFESASAMEKHKEIVKATLLQAILKRSANGVYSPYGPLFWYVPKYYCYAELLKALCSLMGDDCYNKAVALTRDVCWIMGRYDFVTEISADIDGKAIFDRATELGVRSGLCEYFFVGKTMNVLATLDVYPRCFNIEEVDSRRRNDGRGFLGRALNPFEDDLGLYSHEMITPFGEEFVGIVAMPYNTELIEETLNSRSCAKLCGLFLSPTEEKEFSYPNIYRPAEELMIYVPENIVLSHLPNREHIVLCDEIVYYTSCGGVFKLPEGIPEVSKGAFLNCTQIYRVVIPESVEKIGDSAFSGCWRLEAVDFKGVVKWIENDAFAWCERLKKIDLPEGVVSIGDDAFVGCRSLYDLTLPESIECIGSYAFEECELLKNVVLPTKLFEIPYGAFNGCESLRKININNAEKIGSYAFGRCYALEEIEIPSTMKSISWGAFASCTSLKRVTFHDNCELSIGVGAFENCISVEEITLPSKLKECDRAFSGCRRLKIIRNCLPYHTHASLGIDEACIIECKGSVSEKCISITDEIIEKGNYAGDSSITHIEMSDEVRVIGYEAFSGCTNLSKIKWSKNLECIDDRAFEACRSLKDVDLPRNLNKLGYAAFRDCTSLEEFVLPLSVREIDSMTFEGCYSLRDVRLHAALESIGNVAFGDCKSLKQIDLPDNIKSIGALAFDGCGNLEEVSIPLGVTELQEALFSNCTSLKKVNLHSGVSEIGKDVFSNCESLVEINLPDGMKTIGYGAFSRCRKLNELKLPNGLREIAEAVFMGCGSLTTLEIPTSVRAIHAFAFAACESLEQIELPKELEEIGKDAFYGCRKLKEIEIPDGVEELKDNVFAFCESLEKVRLSKNLTRIADSVFTRCKSLTEVEIPEMVKVIGESAFSDCVSLKRLVIPSGVEKLGANILEGCDGLEELTLPRRFEGALDMIFPDRPERCKINFN